MSKVITLRKNDDGPDDRPLDTNPIVAIKRHLKSMKKDYDLLEQLRSLSFTDTGKLTEFGENLIHLAVRHGSLALIEKILRIRR